MIDVVGLSKTYKIPKRNKGIGSALYSLVKREYRYIKALDNVSFHINRGEIVGYIGPNGAGKSTTIKILSGILRPTSGTCFVDGICPYEQRQEHVGNIGVVFGQRSQLWWDVPVIDSFELLRDIYSIDQKSYDKTFDLVSQTLGLKDFLDSPTRQLSLGQRMRCELAASLLHSPKILFLDEPTIGLDAVSKLAVRKFIKTINKEQNVTVILTTHDMSDIESLTERTILIGNGEKLYDGSFQHLRETYSMIRKLEIVYDSDNQNRLPHFITIESNSENLCQLTYDVREVNLSGCIELLSRRFNITDLRLRDEPTEHIIAKIYEDYKL